MSIVEVVDGVGFYCYGEFLIGGDYYLVGVVVFCFVEDLIGDDVVIEKNEQSGFDDFGEEDV